MSDTLISSLAGVDNLSLDKRKFDPSRDDIEGICRFFSIGKLKNYKKEKDITVSHSNFFVFAATAQGPHALKFYPLNSAKTIAVEYALNRLLTKDHFPTPVMHAGANAKPFVASNGCLATCYSFINGIPAWQQIKKRNTIQQINATMFSLKNILSAYAKDLPFQKQEGLPKTITSLIQASRLTSTYDQGKLIKASLRDASKTYQRHQPLFTRQILHNNSNLTNFLIHHKKIYTLDLSHVREDYALADLSSLVISCLFFDIPRSTIKTIVKNYFTQHKLKPEYALVLNTLVKIGLLKEYLKNIERENSLELSTYPWDIARNYKFYLSKRKKLIEKALQ